MKNINLSINEFGDGIKDYIEQLTEKEKIFWAIIISGLLLIVVGLVIG